MSPVTRVRSFVYRYPLNKPVVTSFGSMHDRPAVLVCVEDRDGAMGWGEVWCNFPHCGAEHRARLIDSLIAPRLLGLFPDDPLKIFSRMEKELHVLGLQTAEFGPIAQVLAGMDIALWDLKARRAGLPLRKLLNDEASDTIPVYASGISPDAVDHIVPAVRSEGHRAYKLKVGFGKEKDVAAARLLRDMLKADENMMLDANQAWNEETATSNAAALEEFEPAWLEEPLPADSDWKTWKKLAESTSIPLAAGENIRGLPAFEEAATSGALRVVQPDICKWGGFSGCAPAADIIRKANLVYCPHYLGAGIGLMASAQLLSASRSTGLLEIDCNPNPLRTLLAQPYPPINAGRMRMPDSPGLGVIPAIEETKSWCCQTTEAH
jgi:D-galactarolactone cycloisomerase